MTDSITDQILKNALRKLSGPNQSSTEIRLIRKTTQGISTVSHGIKRNPDGSLDEYSAEGFDAA